MNKHIRFCFTLVSKVLSTKDAQRCIEVSLRFFVCYVLIAAYGWCIKPLLMFVQLAKHTLPLNRIYNVI